MASSTGKQYTHLEDNWNPTGYQSPSFTRGGHEEPLPYSTDFCEFTETITDETAVHIGDQLRDVTHTRVLLDSDRIVGGRPWIEVLTSSGIEVTIELDQLPFTKLRELFALNHGSIASNPQGMAIARQSTWTNRTADALVSLYELKDFKHSILRTFANVLADAKRQIMSGKGPWKARALKAFRTVISDAFLFSSEEGKSGSVGSVMRKTLVGLTSLDLEWKFAWMPLMKDIRAVQSALRDSQRVWDDQLFKLIPMRGSYTTEASLPRIVNAYQALHQFFELEFREEVTITERRTSVVGTYLRPRRDKCPEPGELRSELLKTQLGLNADRILTNAYQVVPASFILDWFYPVSVWTEQIDALLRADDAFVSDYFEVVGHWVSDKSQMTYHGATSMREVNPHVYNYADVVSMQRTAAVLEGQKLSYIRTQVASLPEPIIWSDVTIPQTRMPSLSKWWTLCEIALQKVLAD